MKTIIISKTFFGANHSINKLRDIVLLWAKENLQDNKFYNKSIDAKIEFTWQGLKHDISSSYEHYEDKLHSVSALKDIIRNATLVKKEQNLKGDKKGMIFKMMATISVSGKLYDVWIVVKESNKRFFYDHGLLLK